MYQQMDPELRYTENEEELRSLPHDLASGRSISGW
jgi:hypothetical protein